MKTIVFDFDGVIHIGYKGWKDGSFMFGRNKLQLDYFDSYLWIINQYCEVIENIFDKEVNQ